MRSAAFPGRGPTRLPLLIACCASFLSGCSFFGYHQRQEPVWAPPEEAERVVFPNSYEGATQLDGPSMAALEVARSAFMPPGSKAQAPDERMARCLLRRDVYDVSVLKVNDNLFFVSFSPEFSRCGLETKDLLIFDAGATYAIDGQGRVLAVQ